MKNRISANDLKTRGVSILDQITSDNEVAVITVRGRSRYVVIPVENTTNCGNMSWRQL